MTKVVGKTVIIEHEPESTCDDCGETAECRPYGPNGTSVCFDCAMKDEAGMEARMFALWDAKLNIDKPKGEA